MANTLRNQIANSAMLILPTVVIAAGLMTACAATLPPPNGPGNSGSTEVTASLLSLSGSNTNVVTGDPRSIYERIARQASRCWFGPFGSVHDQYMMHADVPPPTSTAPVTLAVHRRLPSRKKPWGTALLRVQFSGTSTTTLDFQNVGLSQDILGRMTQGITRWANGQTDCPVLRRAEPQWAPQAVSTRNSTPTARR
jgi:hypothetical protein